MNCKNCIYIKCLKRTDEEFDVCPVEVAKREFNNKKVNKEKK